MQNYSQELRKSRTVDSELTDIADFSIDQAGGPEYQKAEHFQDHWKNTTWAVHRVPQWQM